MKGFSKEDQMATLVEWTVVSIVKSFEFFPTPPVQMFLCGGGAKNSYLIKRLQFHATQTEIKTTADLNWPVQAVEGAAFAYLAHQRWQNNKLKGSDFTGAKAPVFYGELLTKS